MEICERDNNLLYGVSPRQLLSGYLPQNKDVDLCVESYIYEGHGEKEAANFTACDLIQKYSVLGRRSGPKVDNSTFFFNPSPNVSCIGLCHKA